MALNAQGFGSFDGTHQFSMKDYQDYQNTYGNQPGWDARQQQYLGYYGATPDMLASGATAATPTAPLTVQPTPTYNDGFSGIQGNGTNPEPAPPVQSAAPSPYTGDLVAPKMMDGGRQSGGVYTGGGYTLPQAQTNYAPQPGTGPAYGGGNPYLDMQAGNIGRQSGLALTQALNGIQSNSVGNGTMGSDRQGLAQGTAIGQAQDSLQGNLANLYGTDWTGQQNRNLTKQGLDQTYTLGQGALDNQKYATDTGFYSTQRGQDQNGLVIAGNLINSGANGQWSPINNANATYSPYTGLGSTSSGTSQGGGVAGGVGGAMSGAALAQLLKLWGG